MKVAVILVLLGAAIPAGACAMGGTMGALILLPIILPLYTAPVIQLLALVATVQAFREKHVGTWRLALLVFSGITDISIIAVSGYLLWASADQPMWLMVVAAVSALFAVVKAVAIVRARLKIDVGAVSGNS